MNKPDLALNNLQWLICHKTKPNQTKLSWRPELEPHHQMQSSVIQDTDALRVHIYTDRLASKIAALLQSLK